MRGGEVLFSGFSLSLGRFQLSTIDGHNTHNFRWAEACAFASKRDSGDGI